MFCVQCEHTIRTPVATGCSYAMGMCGKTSEVSDLQDVLIYLLQGVSAYALKARTFGIVDRAIDAYVCQAFFATLTNVNFDSDRILAFINEAQKARASLKERYEAACVAAGQLPEAATGIAATAVFCFITAWNEYAFALIMTNRRAQTAPPFIPSQVGSGLPDWTVIAAGTVLFLLPVAVFTFLLRNHLLRGMSFGAIPK